jgi:hypothetical protein
MIPAASRRRHGLPYRSEKNPRPLPKMHVIRYIHTNQPKNRWNSIKERRMKQSVLISNMSMMSLMMMP